MGKVFLYKSKTKSGKRWGNGAGIDHVGRRMGPVKASTTGSYLVCKRHRFSSCRPTVKVVALQEVRRQLPYFPQETSSDSPGPAEYSHLGTTVLCGEHRIELLDFDY